jgi:hypothetical protein
MEDLVEREFSGFLGAGSEFGQQRTEAGQSDEASNEAPSSKLLILFIPRLTNVLYCPNSGEPLRGGQGEVAYSWWEDITYVIHRFVLHALHGTPGRAGQVGCAPPGAPRQAG